MAAVGSFITAETEQQVSVNTSPVQTESMINPVQTIFANNGHMQKRCWNRDVYYGELLNEQPNGWGTLNYATGDKYEGHFLQGRLHGRGTLNYANGIVYAGEFSYGQCCGHGKMTFPNGDTYEGQISYGKFHGQGTFRYANGDEYKGEFFNGTFNGQGTLSLFGQDIQITGNFVNGEKNGLFSISSKRLGISQNVEFVDDFVKFVDKNNISDPIFFDLLFGDGCLSMHLVDAGYAMGIASDYLKDYFANDLNVNETVVKPLMEATEFLKITHNESSFEQICNELKNGRSYLLPYGTNEHAMLLNLTPSADRQFIDIEIYNSGNGLKFHDYDKETNKYQLMKKYRVPVDSLDASVIEHFIQNVSCESDIGKAYELFPFFKGGESCVAEQPVWKRAQKGNTCSLECVFAFLGEKLPADVYKAMRKKLFQDCLNAASANTNDFGNSGFVNFPRVKEKVKKLGLQEGLQN